MASAVADSIVGTEPAPLPAARPVALPPAPDVTALRGPISETLGVVRAISDPDGAQAEFAILIRSDVKGRGLGAVLMKKVIGYCRERKIGELVGDILATNTRMLALARDLGFEITASEDPSVVRAKLALARLATA